MKATGRSVEVTSHVCMLRKKYSLSTLQPDKRISVHADAAAPVWLNRHPQLITSSDAPTLTSQCSPMLTLSYISCYH